MTEYQGPPTIGEIATGLEAPFGRDAIKQRKGAGGKQLDYIPGHYVIQRLNDTCLDWSFEMVKSGPFTSEEYRWEEVAGTSRKQRVTGAVPGFQVEGKLTIPGLGTRSGIGVQLLEEGGGIDLYKGAYTDCLKNCAKYFGVGLHLYFPGSQTPGSAQPAGVPAQRQPASTPAPYEDDYQEWAPPIEYDNRASSQPARGGGDFRAASEKQVFRIMKSCDELGMNPLEIEEYLRGIVGKETIVSVESPEAGLSIGDASTVIGDLIEKIKANGR